MKTMNHLKLHALLTSREKEVITLIVEECSTKEIADKLFLSSETIKTHRRNIMLKLDVRNVAGIVREAILKGIVDFGIRRAPASPISFLGIAN